ncbi:dynein light chain Tctex-type 1 [Dichotomocladium elegans]|nr:dynein light chain Tctex-type 1 [Dichotomocladium elegans]
MVSQQLNESKITKDDMLSVVKESVETVLKDVDYVHSKVAGWNSDVIEACLSKLKTLNKNYKYVVTSVILQKNGAGFYAGSSVYWDSTRDDNVSYRHETKSYYALINVFALSI